MSPKPIVLQVTPFPDADQAALDAAYTMLRYDQAKDHAAFLQECGQSAQAIVTRGGAGVPAKVLAACSNAEMIAVYGVGYDKIDIEACRARNVRVTNTPDVLTGDVADLAVALMLASARNVIGADDLVRSGRWAESGPAPLQNRVFGRKAGILGFGRIGRAVAQRLSGFDMDIAYADIAPQDDATGLTFLPDPIALARHSDFLFVTLAATAQTRHIVDRSVIEAVGSTGTIINVSRAANVDEDALITALQTGTLGSAALDVFENEPNINPRWATTPNAILQPHHASATHQTRAAMGQLMRDNLAAYFAGQPLLTPVC